jgi:hypothetical protein
MTKYPVIMAAALIGNLLVESGAANLPTRADNGLGCHGIAQWCDGRWTNEGNFAKTVPGGRYKLEVQLEFVQHELGTFKRTACRTIRDDARAGNLDQATLDVARLYEGAVNGDGSLQDPDDRVHDAHSVYTAYLRGAFG